MGSSLGSEASGATPQFVVAPAPVQVRAAAGPWLENSPSFWERAVRRQRALIQQLCLAGPVGAAARRGPEAGLPHHCTKRLDERPQRLV